MYVNGYDRSSLPPRPGEHLEQSARTRVRGKLWRKIGDERDQGDSLKGTRAKHGQTDAFAAETAPPLAETEALEEALSQALEYIAARTRCYNHTRNAATTNVDE